MKMKDNNKMNNLTMNKNNKLMILIKMKAQQMMEIKTHQNNLNYQMKIMRIIKLKIKTIIQNSNNLEERRK